MSDVAWVGRHQEAAEEGVVAEILDAITGIVTFPDARVASAEYGRL